MYFSFFPIVNIYILISNAVYIGLDKSGYQQTVFVFLHENICCGYSFEAPRRINTSGLKIASYQELCFQP